jgi:hypothetical protein
MVLAVRRVSVSIRLPVVLAAALSSACSSGAGGDGASTTPASGATDAGLPGSDAAALVADAGAGAEADIPTTCSTPLDQRPDGGVCVLEATGRVTDLSGQSLADVVMTFCGSICYGSRSDSSGAFVIPVGDYLDTEDYALHADGRPDHAVDYLRMQAGEPQVVTATMKLPTLPPSSVQLPPDGAPASTVTVGDVTLAIAAGTTFDLDVEDFGTAAGRTLRVASVAMADAPSHAVKAALDAVYALAPSGAKSSSPMGVTVRNTAGLPASAAVDVLVLGDDYFSIPPNVGVFSVAASAHVSADGATIQTDPGQGISELTWLGLRRKGN